MTATYSGDPATSERDLVRFLCGDTGEQNLYWLTDPELDYLIAKYPAAPYRAASKAARRCATKAAQRADTTVGDTSIASSKLAAQFKQAERDLEEEATQAAPTVSGAFLADPCATLRPPNFALGQHDHP